MIENALNPSIHETRDPFQILSIDGGGILGALVAGFLAGLEEQIGRPLGEHFDLIAGTSTGGIIAAALAFREPASKIERFYREQGPLIFRRRKVTVPTGWRRTLKETLGPWFDRHVLSRCGLDLDQILQSKYTGDQLKAALTAVFGEKSLGESQTRLVIPSVDLTNGQTKVFKTPHLPGLHIDLHLPIVDIVMATTAAPTFFPHATIQPGSMYVDGGLWANNPVMAAIAESIAIDRNCRRPVDPRFSLETTSVLSIGTGRCKQFMKPPTDGAGIAWWMTEAKLMRLTMMSQAQGALFQARYFLAGENLMRIDFELPDNSWKLDSICYLGEMIHNGRQKAAETLAALRPKFFHRKAPAYTAFTPGWGT
ncbi:MAG: CBASS cGAMP-activated phospholipase [Isosphaeraceae bacterium]